ncbi:MAG: hypothetical protein AAFR35_09935 [Pseudomonadota bacterium]
MVRKFAGSRRVRAAVFGLAGILIGGAALACPVPEARDLEDGWVLDPRDAAPTVRPGAAAIDAWAGLVARLRNDGKVLVVLVPPPRGAVAPGLAEAERTGLRHTYRETLDAMRATGAIAVDLLPAADRSVAFHFRADPHWTTEGALESAISLADATGRRGVRPADLRLSRSGASMSLTGAMGGCGAGPRREDTPIYVLPDVVPPRAGPRIALVGTSFVDLHRRDYLRVQPAIRAATGAEVDLHAHGSDPFRAMARYLLSPRSDEGRHDLVVWVLPPWTDFDAGGRLDALVGTVAMAAGREPNL